MLPACDKHVARKRCYLIRITGTQISANLFDAVHNAALEFLYLKLHTTKRRLCESTILNSFVFALA